MSFFEVEIFQHGPVVGGWVGGWVEREERRVGGRERRTKRRPLLRVGRGEGHPRRPGGRKLPGI